MDELANAIAVDFPLEGEWFAPNTPGKRIPSHGTDALGQRYAFDFMMAEWSGEKKKLFRANGWIYYLSGIPLSRWYGWGREVYAPCSGRILIVKDGLKERQRVHLLTDLFVVFKNALFFDPRKHDLQRICGNYVILQTENAFAMLAHFQRKSICVTEGQEVKAGELLGRVGHSGNSTAPHLHFQLMDSSDLFAARGLPCAFERYERYQDGKWVEVPGGIPSDQDRIRRYCNNQ